MITLREGLYLTKIFNIKIAGKRYPLRLGTHHGGEAAAGPIQRIAIFKSYKK